MKLVAAYLLVQLSGKTPDEKSILDVLSSVGVEGDKAQIQKLLSELNGKDVAALIEQGKTKLATVNLGGGGGGGGGAAPAEEKKDAGKKDDAKGKDAGKGKEAPKKKEEPKEEKKEEEEGDFGFGLFD